MSSSQTLGPFPRKKSLFCTRYPRVLTWGTGGAAAADGLGPCAGDFIIAESPLLERTLLRFRISTNRLRLTDVVLDLEDILTELWLPLSATEVRPSLSSSDVASDSPAAAAPGNASSPEKIFVALKSEKMIL